jgi:DNA-binding NarL/FixJ family response regulator
MALRDLPILMVSAHRDEHSLMRMKQMGISGFLFKPVDASVLVAKVAEALAG